MKQLLLLICIIQANFLVAQNDYLITLKGDSLVGKIDLRQARFYDELTIKTDEGKQNFRVYAIKKVVKEENTFEMVTFNNKKVFGQVVEKGSKASLYLVRNDGNQSFVNKLITKNDGKSAVLQVVKFKNTITKLFDDCPELIERLDNKEFSMQNLSELLQFYEDCELGG